MANIGPAFRPDRWAASSSHLPPSLMVGCSNYNRKVFFLFDVLGVMVYTNVRRRSLHLWVGFSVSIIIVVDPTIYG